LREDGLTFREVGQRLGGVGAERARQIYRQGVQLIGYETEVPTDVSPQDPG
jgi:hypothetical protein